MEHNNNSVLQSFYADKVIFLTGATGLLGKSVVEKLLRTCTQVRKIYILIRPRKNVPSAERFRGYCQDAVFNRVRHECPDFHQKITLIEGDMELPKLGMSESDQQLLMRTVNIIFHLAATVNFAERLSLAVQINLCGTKYLLDLAQRAPSLDVFMHVSTVGVYCEDPVEESMYDYTELIDWRALLKEPELNRNSAKLLGNCVNTYSFTKLQTEFMLRDCRGDTPLGIMRPGALTCTVNEPEPNWIPDAQGLYRILMAMDLEQVRAVHAHPDHGTVVTPTDLFTNALLACTFQTYNTYQLSTPTEIPIYNYTVPRAQIDCDKLFNGIFAYMKADPLLKTTIGPTLILEDRDTTFEYLNLILSRIPYDIQHHFSANESKALTAKGKADRQMQKYMEVCDPYLIRNWDVQISKTMAVWHTLSVQDKKLFPFNIYELDVHHYVHGMFLSIRRLSQELMSEDESKSKL